MEVVETYERGTAIFSLSGRFEFSTRKTFLAAIQKAQADNFRTVVLDMEGLSFADNTAVAILKLTQDSLKQSGGTLILAALQPCVFEVLNRMSITKFIPTVSSVNEALGTSLACNTII